MVYAQAMSTAAIRWPDRFAPENAPVHVVNALTVAASPEAVWRVLISAADWPFFYANASRVTVEDDRPVILNGHP